ncbi:hypothetical protein WJX73_000676 [Symbiochloris irregularis]|uniref:F-box domain-containing protein n=1 Tax=Symbiochloris irregularis TaxID=706552 RepID=A0AAW1NVC0_9CHLO
MNPAAVANGQLPAELLSRIFGLLPNTSLSTLREVCKAWRSAADGWIHLLSPRQIHIPRLERWHGLTICSLRRLDKAMHKKSKPPMLALLQRKEFDLLLLPFYVSPLFKGNQGSDAFHVRHFVLEGSGYRKPQQVEIRKLDEVLARTEHLVSMTLRGMVFNDKAKLAGYQNVWKFSGQLHSLSLHGCKSIPWEYMRHLELKRLHLHCPIAWDDVLTVTLKELAQLTTLEHLDFTAARRNAGERFVETAHFAALSGLQLTHLAFRDLPQLADQGLLALSALTTLRGLDVLSQHTGLTHLDIGLRDCSHSSRFVFHTWTSSSIQHMLPSLQHLSSLCLGGCNIENAGSCFSSLQGLTSLDLNCTVTDSSPYPTFTALTKLKRLGVPNCHLTVRDLACIGTIKSLAELNIAGCLQAAMHFGQLYLLTALTRLSALQNLAVLPLEALRVWKAGYPRGGEKEPSRFEKVDVKPLRLDILEADIADHEFRDGDVPRVWPVSVPRNIKSAIAHADLGYPCDLRSEAWRATKPPLATQV